MFDQRYSMTSSTDILIFQGQKGADSIICWDWTLNNVSKIVYTIYKAVLSYSGKKFFIKKKNEIISNASFDAIFHWSKFAGHIGK